MGLSYGGGYGAPPSGYPSPPRQVNWGWISESWQLFSQASGVWVPGVLLYGIASTGIRILLQGLFSDSTPTAIPNHYGVPDVFWRMFFGQLSALGEIISYAVSVALGGLQGACFYRMAVKQMRGGSLEFGDLFNPGSIFLSMVLFNLIYAFANVLGVFACCIGIFVVMGLLLPGAALVADGEGPWQATVRSFEAMKGDWANATGFMLVFLLVVILSVLPCGLGLFATLPMQHLISALAYRDMIGLTAIRPPGAVDFGAPQTGVWPPPPNTDISSPPNPGIWPPPSGGPPPPAV